MPASAQIRPLAGLAAALTALRQPAQRIRGVNETTWLGPLQPVRPVAPPGTPPALWQYWPGQNLQYTPRANEPLSAAELRAIAAYPLAAMIRKSVIDQVVESRWSIRVKPQPGESDQARLAREKGDKTAAQLQAAIEYPNSAESWKRWMRPILEDMLVLDAPAALVRRSQDGRPFDLQHVDGATIARYIDAEGFQPMPPDPAYAQVWFGIPRCDLTADQLVYLPAFVQSDALYGTSPTEMAFRFLALGDRRLEFKSTYYTAGTIPDAIQVVPRGVMPGEIQQQQDAINSSLAGDLAKRRGVRLIQGFADTGK